jgi:hypothetical protein
MNPYPFSTFYVVYPQVNGFFFTYIYMYVHLYMHNVRKYTYSYMYVYRYTVTYTYTYMHIYVSFPNFYIVHSQVNGFVLQIYIDVRTFICAYLYVNLYIHIYIYVYRYTLTYTYRYMHIYISFPISYIVHPQVNGFVLHVYTDTYWYTYIKSMSMNESKSLPSI